MVKLLCLIILFTHGDLDERIAKVTRQIERDSDNGALYLERAKLYFQHEDYVLSKGDLQQAHQLSTHSPEWHFLMARVMHVLSEQDSALWHITLYLDDPNHTQHINAINLKADVLYDQGEYMQAAGCYAQGLALNPTPDPEDVVKTANAYLQVNSKDASIKAILVLQNAKEKLGDLFVIDKILVSAYEMREDYDSAIAVLTDVMSRSRRKEAFYVQRARLYSLQGNPWLSTLDLDNALREIENLRGAIRNSDATRALMTQINEMKEQVK